MDTDNYSNDTDMFSNDTDNYSKNYICIQMTLICIQMNDKSPAEACWLVLASPLWIPSRRPEKSFVLETSLGFGRVCGDLGVALALVEGVQLPDVRVREPLPECCVSFVTLRRKAMTNLWPN